MQSRLFRSVAWKAIPVATVLMSAPARTARPDDSRAQLVDRTPPTVAVRFEEVRRGASEGENAQLELHIVSHGTSYYRVCAAPCDTVLQPGSYTMGLSRHRGKLVGAEPVTLTRPSIVRGEYVPWNLALFVGGVVLHGAGLAGGIATLYVAQHDTDRVCRYDAGTYVCSPRASWLYVTLFMVSFLSHVAGFYAAAASFEHASISVTPLSLASPARGETTATTREAHGAALRIGF